MRPNPYNSEKRRKELEKKKKKEEKQLKKTMRKESPDGEPEENLNDDIDGGSEDSGSDD